MKITTNEWLILTSRMPFVLHLTFKKDDYGIYGHLAFGLQSGGILTEVEKSHNLRKIWEYLAKNKKRLQDIEFEKVYYSDMLLKNSGVGVLEFSLGDTYASRNWDIRWYLESLHSVLDFIDEEIFRGTLWSDITIESPNDIHFNHKSKDTKYIPKKSDSIILPKWLEWTESSQDQEIFTHPTEPELAQYTLADMWGNKILKEEIKKLISFYKNRSHFQKWNINPPRGVLLYGPPGTGKTLAAKIIANEIGMHFYSLSSSEILSKWVGESARNLKLFFKKIQFPCIVFIDEIDSLVPNRDGDNMKFANPDEIQVINELLKEIDGIGDKNEILFIGATNRINAIDPALLRAGRLDYKILLDYPDHEARKEIWNIYIKKTLEKIEYKNIDSWLDLDQLAKMSDRFTGADIAEIIRRMLWDYAIGMLASERVSTIINGKTTLRWLLFLIEKYKSERNFNQDIIACRPIERLTDIGGSDILKTEITKLIKQYKYRQLFEDSGIDLPRWILLYGPSGTGKTLAAKVIAWEIGEVFYILNPRDFISKWSNESLVNLEKIFQSLQTPCIVFIDEIDAILGKRSGVNNAWDDIKIINAFLQYMDGFRSKNDILFIWATNRIDAIDEAILRAGRFDTKILVDYPDEIWRKEIWTMYIKKSNLKSKKWDIFDNNIDYTRISDMSDRFTGADIAEVIRRIKQNFIFNQTSLIESNTMNDIIRIDTQYIMNEIHNYILEKNNSSDGNKIWFNL